MGWFSTRERIFKPAKIRIAFLAIATAAFIVTEFGRYVYRPFVRRNAIQDFGLADSIGNLGGIIVQIFFLCAVLNSTKIQSYRWAGFLSAGYIVYEFVQPYLPKGVFDWKDIYATIIGLIISLIVLWFLWYKFPPENEIRNK